MEKLYVGVVEALDGDKPLCVMASNPTEARRGMELVVMSLDGCFGSIKYIREATEEEQKILVPNQVPDPY